MAPFVLYFFIDYFLPITKGENSANYMMEGGWRCSSLACLLV